MTHQRRVALLNLVSLAGVVACGGGGDAVEPTQVIVTIEPGQHALAGLGQSVTLTARVSGTRGQLLDLPVSWSSSAPTVAAVVPGAGRATTATVTSVGAGTTQVNASAGSGSAVAQVTVTARCSAITLDQRNLSLIAGDSGAVTGRASCDPGMATTLTWTSISPSQLRTTAAGAYRALSRGSGYLRAAATADATTPRDSVLVQVAGPVKLTLSPKAPPALAPSQTLQFAHELEVDPRVPQTVEWRSSDETVATVSTQGLVTAVRPGQSTIRARSPLDTAVTDQVVLTVRPHAVTAVKVTGTDSVAPTLTVTLQASVTAEPGADLAVNWSSLDPLVASVSATGVVTGLSVGTARIVATSRADPSRQDTYPVRVRPAITSFALDSRQVTIGVNQRVTLGTRLVAFPGVTPTLEWSSSSPGIFSVDALGGVIGVAKGTAIVRATAAAGGQELEDSAQVTVTDLAATIGGVRTEAGAPADLRDIRGVIQVDVTVAIPPGSMADAVTLTLGSREVGRRTAVGPGNLTFTVNTAEWDNTSFVPTFPNGTAALSSRLEYQGTNVPGSPLSLDLRNTDVLVTRPITLPPGLPSVTGTATPFGSTWYKGTVTQGVVQVAFGAQAFDSVRVSSTCGALLLSRVAGSGAPRFSGPMACATTEGPVSLQPTAATAYRAGAGTSTGYANYTNASQSPALSLGVNIDNKPPTVAMAGDFQAPGYWIGPSFAFDQAVLATDAGSQVQGGPEVFDVASNSRKVTGNDYAQTTTATSTDGYRIYVKASDRLGNSAQTDSSEYFGVDKTPPEIRYSGGTVFAPGTDTVTAFWVGLGVEYRDLHSGLPSRPEWQSVVTFQGSGVGCSSSGTITGDWRTATCVPTSKAPAAPRLPDGWDVGDPLYGANSGYYLFRSYVVDKAGNRSTEIARKVYVDVDTPAGGIQFSPNFATTTNGTASVFAYDDAELDSMSLAFNYGFSEISYPQWRRDLGTKWDNVWTQNTNQVFQFPHGTIRSIEQVDATHVLPNNPSGLPPIGVAPLAWDMRLPYGYNVDFAGTTPPSAVGAGLYASGARTFQRLGTSGANVVLQSTSFSVPLQRVEYFDAAGMYVGVTFGYYSFTQGVPWNSWRWNFTSCTTGKTYFAVGVTSAGDGIATQPFTC